MANALCEIYSDLLTKSINKQYTAIMKDNVLSKLSQYLFWDCNINSLDPNVDRNLILERVFSRGTENDEREALIYYGINRIKHTILDINYLDKKTLNYLSIAFSIPKEEFKCYKHSLSGNPFGIF
jgi:hypothetical protein